MTLEEYTLETTWYDYISDLFWEFTDTYICKLPRTSSVNEDYVTFKV